MLVEIVDLNTVVTYADALHPDIRIYHLLLLEKKRTKLCLALIRFQELQRLEEIL